MLNLFLGEGDVEGKASALSVLAPEQYRRTD